MPELPEVESAARELRRAVAGRTLARLRLIHPALQRRVTAARLRRLAGKRIDQVERRGKNQLLTLDDGTVIHVHFRMAGDWVVETDPAAELPRHARAVLELDDGTRVVLADPRALSSIEVHAPGRAPALQLGPEPGDAALDPESLHASLAKRRAAIKPALLDQRIVAGVGNIYAAEALWEARLSPLAPAASLTRAELARVIAGLRTALDAGARRPGRYAAGMETERLAVYGREGEPCRRCRTPIERIVQAGRSTYFCPRCQGMPRAKRRSRQRA